MEASEFESLLQKEFKPKSDQAKQAVQNAVQTLAAQALQKLDVDLGRCVSRRLRRSSRRSIGS